MSDTLSKTLLEAMRQLGGRATKRHVLDWFDAHYKNQWKKNSIVMHLYSHSVNNPKAYIHHPNSPRVLFALGNGLYEIYDPHKHGNYDNDGLPLGEQPNQVDEECKNDEVNSQESFAYEAHLRDYLAKNLQILELGLKLWKDNPESVEFSLDGRWIDILAEDKSGLPVVIELKVSRGHERTIGQALYYRAKLKQLLSTKAPRIFIVAQEITEELSLACKEVPDVILFEYTLSMSVKEADLSRSCSVVNFSIFEGARLQPCHNG